jgi:hypothetical protein
MKPIGGFFELETGAPRGAYHSDALALTNGRTCLHLLLQQTRPCKVHLPYYTCDSLVQPVVQAGIPHDFYAVDHNLEPVGISVGEDECLVYVNYFGLRRATVARLAQQYGSRLIVDNTQAFFEKGMPGVASFNSARKFFGVPDGGYLYGGTGPAEAPPNADVRCDHLIDRLLGRQSQAYAEYTAAEAAQGCDIQAMSVLSAQLLDSVDYAAAAQKRRSNYGVYRDRLGTLNQLACPMDPGAVPFCYPLLLKNPFPRERLFAQNIFVPTLWNEVQHRIPGGFAFEKQLAQNLLPLPLDQRYDETDCLRVIDAVLAILE